MLNRLALMKRNSVALGLPKRIYIPSKKTTSDPLIMIIIHKIVFIFLSHPRHCMSSKDLGQRRQIAKVWTPGERIILRAVAGSANAVAARCVA